MLAASIHDDTVWYENDGEENFTEHIISNFNGYGAYSVYAEDVDGDGYGDNENFISFFGGEPSKYFKGRQFNQNYYLEFFPDGYFTHLWYDHYTDTGYFRTSPSGNRLFLYYESGMYSGESHVIDIINYRKIHYRFRNCSYFIAPKRNELTSNS